MHDSCWGVKCVRVRRGKSSLARSEVGECSWMAVPAVCRQTDRQTAVLNSSFSLEHLGVSGECMRYSEVVEEGDWHVELTGKLALVGGLCSFGIDF